MSAGDLAKKEYDAGASNYDVLNTLPLGQIESQLIRLGLGDCTGLTVLDLGGGTGLHARAALALGASRVDVVDISPEMLRVGEGIEASLGREGVVRYFAADASRPFGPPEVPVLPEGYDVVMGNWLFSHADTRPVLDGMLANIAAHLKPGGLYVGAHNGSPEGNAAHASGRYGTSSRWVSAIEGGVKYRAVLHTGDPPVEFESCCLDAVWDPETYRAHGLVDVRDLPYAEAECVRRDPEFWALFLEKPFMAVVQARKAEA